MKVYFVASPRAKKIFGRDIETAYNAISELGYQHTSDFIERVDPEALYDLDQKEIIDHYRKTMKAVKDADMIVVDVSVASMSMGYIVDRANEYSKPVIILHTKGNEPFFFSGIQDDRVQIVEYGADNAKEVLKSALDYAKELLQTRFTMLMPAELMKFLDKIAGKVGTSKSEYIRKLIERERKRK